METKVNLKTLLPDEYIGKLGLTRHSGDNSLSPCPWCGNDKKNHFFAYKAEKSGEYVFDCKVCNRKDNVIGVYKEMNGYGSTREDGLKAIEELNELFFGIKFEKKEGNKKIEGKGLGSTFERAKQSVNDNVDLFNELLQEKNLTANCGAGLYFHDLKNKSDPSIAFPMRNFDGEIIGIQTRKKGGEKKIVYSSKTGFFFDQFKKNEPLFIVEGLTDFLTLKSVGIDNVLGLYSASQKVDGLDVFLNGFENVRVCLDSDTKPGEDGKARFTGIIKSIALKKVLPKAKIHFVSIDPTIKRDINDLLASGYTKAEFIKFFDTAKEYTTGELSAILKANGLSLEALDQAEEIAKHNNLALVGSEWYNYDEKRCVWGIIDEIEVKGIVIESLIAKSQKQSPKIVNSIIFFLEWFARKGDGVNLQKFLEKNTSKHPELIGILERRASEIFFRNGVLNIENMDFRPHEKEDYILTTLGAEFLPHETETPVFNKFLDGLFNEEKEEYIRFLRQWCGYLVTQDNSRQKALFLLGEGANGKGTLTRILERIIGSDNISTFELGTLDENWAIANIRNKTLNICSEIERTSQLGGIFKQISGGDTVFGRDLYSSPFTFRPITKMLFSCNKLPPVIETKHSIERRLAIIKFPNTFKIDPNFEKELMKELPGILNWMLEGLRDLIDNGFAQPISSIKFVQEYISTGDTFGAWLKDLCDGLRETKQKRVKQSELYPLYRDYFEDSGAKPSKKLVMLGEFRERVLREKLFHDATKYSGEMCFELVEENELLKEVAEIF